MDGKTGSALNVHSSRRGATHAGEGRLVDKRNQVAEEDVELLHVLLRDKPELETEDAAAEDEDHEAARPLELFEVLVVDLGSGSEGLRSQVGLREGHAALACDAEGRGQGERLRTLRDSRAAIEKPVRAGRNAVCWATYVPSSMRDDML